jgi:glutaredoxin 3
MIMAQVEIYTRDWCGYCARAKRLLNERGAPFVEHNVGNDPSALDAMLARAAGRTSVPQIFIDDQHIGGCDDLFALDDAGKLEPMLTS